MVVTKKNAANAAKIRQNDHQKSRKAVTVLNDGMSKRTKANCKSKNVKVFSGATATCMKDNRKTSIPMSPDQFILHIRTII